VGVEKQVKDFATTVRKNGGSKRKTLEKLMATSKKDPRLARAGVSGYNKPKATPSHPTKSHIVVAKSGGQVKTIRFGQQGVKTNQTAGQREAFKSRHRSNIARGPMSAAYWADKVKWSPSKTSQPKNKKWVKGS
jgi:hypothetical protein